MKASQVLALFAVLGSAAAQGVTSILTPPYDAPPACGHSVDGKFELVKAAPEDFLAKRQEILAVSCFPCLTEFLANHRQVQTRRRLRAGQRPHC